jgi:hypothetical protein
MNYQSKPCLYSLDLRQYGQRFVMFSRIPSHDEITSPTSLCASFRRPISDRDATAFRDGTFPPLSGCTPCQRSDQRLVPPGETDVNKRCPYKNLHPKISLLIGLRLWEETEETRWFNNFINWLQEFHSIEQKPTSCYSKGEYRHVTHFHGRNKSI